jgi:hypothetical protein
LDIAVFELCHHFLPVRNIERARKRFAVRLSHSAIRRPAPGCTRSPLTLTARPGKPGLSSLKKLETDTPPEQTQRAGARFTSAADIVATQTDVCFVPIADIRIQGRFLNPPRPTLAKI